MNIKLSVITSIIIFSTSVMAHHGFGRFDMNGSIDLEGTLTDLKFVNPHSYVYFDAVDKDGKVTQMRCEMRAATVLRRSGWSPDLFTKGAHIVINGRPHREDPTSCYVETLKIGEAPSLERYEQISSDEDNDQKDRPLRLANGKPNLSGDWAQEQYLLAQTPGGGFGRLVPKSMLKAVESGELDPSEAPNPGWRLGNVSLTDAGSEASEAIRNLPTEEHPNFTCQITSIIMDWVFDGPINRITQGEDVITIEYGRGLTRTVNMKMDEHPDDIVPSRAGHSIGYWDGDTLVVDTVGFEEGIMSGPVPHSAALHVVERFTLDTETMSLQREYTLDDPLYYREPYNGSDSVLVADAPFAVDQCKELASEYMEDD